MMKRNVVVAIVLFGVNGAGAAETLSRPRTRVQVALQRQSARRGSM